MTYLPFILLTPLVFMVFMLGCAIQGLPYVVAFSLSAAATLALWGVLLLVIN